MPDPRIRREIAVRAAALMYAREESEYFTAKRKAAGQLRIDWKHAPKDLPSNAEIREQVLLLASMLEGDRRGEGLREMRVLAYQMMRLLEPFRPRLIGSTLTGHTRKGSDIDLHVFTDTLPALTDVLDQQGLAYTIEQKHITKHGQSNVYTHVHLGAKHPIELTVYTRAQHRTVFRSSITGKPIERANLVELDSLMKRWYPELDTEALDLGADEPPLDVAMLRLLLAPLESVKQNPAFHPEGDALYHSLQVFELARAEREWDIELCLAALVHDVGKAIDPADHVVAGLGALAGLVSERVLILVAHHMEAHGYRAGTLGARARRRLEQLSDFEDLLLLSDLDQGGRRRGLSVCSLDEALAWLAGTESS
ncbi:MAG: HD domain-containing protein [Planctomycetota bacterium]